MHEDEPFWTVAHIPQDQPSEDLRAPCPSPPREITVSHSGKYDIWFLPCDRMLGFPSYSTFLLKIWKPIRLENSLCSTVLESILYYSFDLHFHVFELAPIRVFSLWFLRLLISHLQSWGETNHFTWNHSFTYLVYSLLVKCLFLLSNVSFSFLY